MLGTACMTFHYGIVLSTEKCFPVPLTSGCSGTGKTLALRCALALYGAHNKHVYQHCTLQYYTSWCSESSIPFGIDDPSHSKELGELMLSVFNGTMTGNITARRAIDLSHLQSSLPTSLFKIKPQGTCMHHNTYVNENEFQWLLVRHSNFIWNAHFFITIYAGAQGSSRSYQFWRQHLHLPLDLELLDLQWFHQALYSLSTLRSYSYVWKNHHSVRYVSRCNLEDWIANTLALVILETAMHPHEQLCGWRTGTLCSFWRPSNDMLGWSLLH